MTTDNINNNPPAPAPSSTNPYASIRDQLTSNVIAARARKESRLRKQTEQLDVEAKLGRLSELLGGNAAPYLVAVSTEGEFSLDMQLVARFQRQCLAMATHPDVVAEALMDAWRVGRRPRLGDVSRASALTLWALDGPLEEGILELDDNSSMPFDRAARARGLDPSAVVEGLLGEFLRLAARRQPMLAIRAA